MTNCYHASSGGIRTFYRALLEAADRHRREVRLVVPGPEDSIEDIGEFGRIYTIAAPSSPFIDSKYRLLLPHLYALPYRSKLRQILLNERPDLVEVCDKYTLCYLPSVVRNHWIEDAPQAAFVGLSCERMDDNVSAFITDSRMGRRFANWYMKSIYAPRFDFHISNSQYTAGELVDALAGRANLPVHVCPMGVDAKNLGPHRRGEAKRAALHGTFVGAARENGKRFNTAYTEGTEGHSGMRDRLLLYVGRISPEKNVSLLVDMMEHLGSSPRQGYKLLVVGAGSLADWLSDNAERVAPGRVHLLGYVSDRERLADIYANCDALIHPNPREPFGIAPLEAMASGLPVVAPLSGGVLSYASEANSWLAEPDGESFANSVHRIFSDENTRRSKVRRAIDTAEQFSWPRTAERFFDLYDNLHTRFQNPALPISQASTAA
jgi:alpha-1,6-mannosyltransferase